MFNNYSYLAHVHPEYIKAVSGSLCVKGSYFLNLGHHVIRPNDYIVKSFFNKVTGKIEYFTFSNLTSKLNIKLFNDDNNNFYLSAYETLEDLEDLKKDPVKLYESGLITFKTINVFEFILNEEDKRIEGIVLEVNENSNRMGKYKDYKFSTANGKNNFFLKLEKCDRELAYDTFIEIIDSLSNNTLEYSSTHNYMY